MRKSFITALAVALLGAMTLGAVASSASAPQAADRSNDAADKNTDAASRSAEVAQREEAARGRPELTELPAGPPHERPLGLVPLM